MKLWTISFILLFSFSLLANETQERLNFVNGEINKINERIKSGQDPKLFKKFLSDFEAEKKQLEDKLKSSQTVTKKKAPVAIKQKTKKTVKKQPQRSAYRTVSVEENTSVEKIKEMLKAERDIYLRRLQNGSGPTSLKQSQINITYLEAELAKADQKPKEKSRFDEMFKYRGHLQFRTETAENRQGIQGTRQSEQSFFRLRTYFTFSPNNKLDVNFTPQATKGFGADESSIVTSGGINHTEVDFFEANFNYKIIPSLDFKLGRQELNYGDHLFIGALPWANTGRSFDAAKFKYTNKYGWSDLVYSKLSDNSTGFVSNDDSDLFLLYNSWDLNNYLNPFDLYFLHLDNDTSATATETNMIGFRVKGSYGNLFYRTENAQQSGARVGARAYQYNIEAGWKFKPVKLSVEYAIAGADYNQLFPTAHLFLGFADVLGRKNVKQTAFHAKSSPFKWLTIRLDYHIFKRNSIDRPAFNLLTNGNFGSVGTSDDVGDEIDVVFMFKTSGNLNIHLGGALFTPGTYLEQNTGSDRKTEFYYLQFLAKF